jgi:PTH1 family peptidyl-tRNA hydrolase
LGNPGERYKHTRHNVGFETIDKLTFDHGIPVKRSKQKAHTGMGRIGKHPALLAKPQTYMNLSGESVKALLQFYQIPPSDMLVIYDDVNLPVGDIRVRETGGAGGHKGMISIIEHLKTQDFPRVRIGIGQKPEGWALADYVLSHFKKGEWEDMIAGITKAGEAVELWLAEGMAPAMNRFNKRLKIKDSDENE